MSAVTDFIVSVNDVYWYGVIALLVGAGLYFSVTTLIVQIRMFPEMLKTIVEKPSDIEEDKKGISAFRAFTISAASRVGTGNVAGVAIAITVGGPGAVFWMWAIAAVGMATSLIECSLAQLFKRREENGDFRGGPARSILFGLGADYKWLAVLYAVGLIASFALGFNAFQGNTVAGAALDSLGIERLWTGIFLAIGTGLIVYGGIHRIAKVADVIVPVMAFGYILLALLVIVMNIGDLPGVIRSIFANAFGFEEAVSGGMGAALAQGLRRGLFSNEAGLGSAPNVAATADVRHPVSQGITQSLSVFIDTFVICSCTAFVILLGKVYVPGAEGIDGVALTQQSLVSHLGDWAQYALTAAILLFAFSSIIYNYYLGENAMSIMTEHPVAIHGLRLVVVAIVFIGAVAPGASAVFFFSDPMMGILAVVNLLALMMLFPTAQRLIVDFRQQLAAGVLRPVLDPDKFKDLNIDRTAWTGIDPDAPKR